MTPEVQSLHLKVRVYGTAGREPHGVYFVGCHSPSGQDACSVMRWTSEAAAGPEVSQVRVREHARMRVPGWALRLGDVAQRY